MNPPARSKRVPRLRLRAALLLVGLLSAYLWWDIPERRAAALRAIGSHGLAWGVVAGEPDPRERAMIACKLIARGVQPEDEAPLVPLIGGLPESEQWIVVTTLASRGPESLGVIIRLIAGMDRGVYWLHASDYDLPADLDRSREQIRLAWPEETAAVAMRLARSPDAVVRSMAVGLLEQCEASSDECFEILLGLTRGDPMEDVRYDAFQTIAELPGRVAGKSELCRWLLDDDRRQQSNSLRDRALRVLYEIAPDRAAVARFACTLEPSGPRGIPYAIVEVLGSHFEDTGEATLLPELLEHDLAPVRVRAAEFLAGMPDVSPEVVRVLLESLQHDPHSVRRSAIQGLARLRQPSREVIEALEAVVLAEGPAPTDRRAVARSRMLGVLPATERLLELASGPDAESARLASKALARLRARGADPGK